MTTIDVMMLALVAWKEARGGGEPGMQAVINVVMNRVARNSSHPYAEIFRPLQFTSMTYQHDPQLVKVPADDDAPWQIAVGLARHAAAGVLSDLTNGATYYYAASIERPPWAIKMVPTGNIGGQIFLRG